MGKMANILMLPKGVQEIASLIEQGIQEKNNCERFLPADSKGSLLLYSNAGERQPYALELDATTSPGCLLPLEKGRVVASIDSTSLPLGYGKFGVISVARVSVVFFSRSRPVYFMRTKPILRVDEMFEANVERIEENIRVELEQEALSVLEESQDSIILLDGSLKHPNSPRQKRYSTSDIVAISKFSSLVATNASMLFPLNSPGYLVVGNGEVKTVIARFTKDGLTLRLDILSNSEIAEILGLLLYNDIFYAGYPESLRLAHHLSSINNAELLCIKSLLRKKYNLVEVPSFPIRDVILGSLKSVH